MASLFPAPPPPPIPEQKKLDQRTLPPNVRQAIVDVHAECPALSSCESASICYARFNRRPSPRTIKMVLATGPKPKITARRYPRYAEIPDPVQRRKAILRLHFEGWNKKSIAGYLQVSRQTVYTALKRFAEEHFAGLHDRSSAPKSPPRKVTLEAMATVKKLAQNPELGAYRMSAALEQMGKVVSRFHLFLLLAGRGHRNNGNGQSAHSHRYHMCRLSRRHTAARSRGSASHQSPFVRFPFLLPSFLPGDLCRQVVWAGMMAHARPGQLLPESP